MNNRNANSTVIPPKNGSHVLETNHIEDFPIMGKMFRHYTDRFYEDPEPITPQDLCDKAELLEELSNAERDRVRSLNALKIADERLSNPITLGRCLWITKYFHNPVPAQGTLDQYSFRHRIFTLGQIIAGLVVLLAAMAFGIGNGMTFAVAALQSYWNSLIFVAALGGGVPLIIKGFLDEIERPQNRTRSIFMLLLAIIASSTFVIAFGRLYAEGQEVIFASQIGIEILMGILGFTWFRRGTAKFREPEIDPDYQKRKEAVDECKLLLTEDERRITLLKGGLAKLAAKEDAWKGFTQSLSKFMLTTLALSAMLAFSASAADLKIGISPHLSKADLSAAKSQISKLVLTNSDPGSNIEITDGWTLASIIDFSVPKLRVDNQRARKFKLKPELEALSTWFERVKSTENSRRGKGWLKTPELFSLWSRSTSPDSEILLIGNGIYKNEEEPELFSFLSPDGSFLVPTLGHAVVSSEFSVFGLRIGQGSPRFSNLSVNWITSPAFPGPEFIESTYRNFWGFWLSHQGGKLLAFSPDFARVFRELGQGSREPFPFKTHRDQLNKMELVPVERRSPGAILVPINLPANSRSTQESQRRVIQSFESEAQRNHQHNIGIWWDGNAEGTTVDLDLYVWVQNSKPLYFNNKTSEHGRYIKDNRAGGNFWEQVALNSPPDSTTRAFVNIFSTSGPVSSPITGKLMFKSPGRPTRFQSFTMKAIRGNKGEGQDGIHRNPHWTDLQLHKLLNIPSTTNSLLSGLQP